MTTLHRCSSLSLRALSPVLRGLALSVLLAACGGGSAGAGPTSAPPPTATLPQVDVSTVAKADPGSALPAQWQHGAFMEIFVRGYKDSNGDGIGDLRGITQSLDYLKDLGIKGIWLMPVTRSQDHDHGYAVTDFRNIENAYGSLADFDELVAQAHARGIGIVIDYVVNHSAAQNPLFLNSAAAPDNPYRSWYVWQSVAPTGWSIFDHNPWITTGNGAYLAQFSPTMPDFNLLNPPTLAYHHDNLRFWLNRGVDGFRFDAVAHLVENGPTAWRDQPGSYAVMGQLHATVSGYARRYMVCEGTANAMVWAQDNNCGSAFAFGHQQDIVNAARGQPEAISAVADYFKTAPASMATMLSNHDLFAGERLWDQLGGNLAQYRLAAATYLLQPGTPFIYYGEEIGMAAGAGLSGDPKLRTPMSWSADPRTAGFSTTTPFRTVSSNVASQNVASQLADPNSLLAFYKDMLRLRNTLPAIASGSYAAPFVSGSVLGFQRVQDSETVLVLINYGAQTATIQVTGLGSSTKVAALYPTGSQDGQADAAGNLQLGVAPQSVRVFKLGS